MGTRTVFCWFWLFCKKIFTQTYIHNTLNTPYCTLFNGTLLYWTLFTSNAHLVKSILLKASILYFSNVLIFFFSWEWECYKHSDCSWSSTLFLSTVNWSCQPTPPSRFKMREVMLRFSTLLSRALITSLCVPGMVLPAY